MPGELPGQYAAGLHKAPVAMARGFSFRKASYNFSEIINEIFKSQEKSVFAGQCKPNDGIYHVWQRTSRTRGALALLLKRF